MTGNFSGRPRPLAAVIDQRPAYTPALEVLASAYESGLIDGIVRRLVANWRLLDRPAIEDAVAEAALGLYDALTDGKTIRDPAAWLWKVAKAAALRRHNELRARADADQLASRTEAEMESTDGVSKDILRSEALAVARSVLPRLGQTSLVSVMDLVFDAVERGIPDLQPKEIAEILGLNSDVVRQSLHRGFQRLARIAEQDGLQLSTDELATQIELQEHEEEPDDDE